METSYLDRSLAELQAHKTEWARLDVAEKADILVRVRKRIGAVARDWVEASCKSKGFTMESRYAGEEWMSGPYALVEGMNAVEDTLRTLAAGRDPLEKVPVTTRPNGQVVAHVFPDNAQDRAFLSGHRAETWMLPEVTFDSLGDTIASFYRQPEPDGAVALVLGAGNITSIPPLDLVDQVFGKGRVGIVKLNPINEFLGDYLEDAFAPMVDAGWVHFAYGGGDVGGYLAHHDAVDAIHITGNAATHNTIVFGPGADGEERRLANRPIIDKPITSELGGVSPTIVVPGPWTKADIQHQAAHIVTQKLHNNGFNCVANQVLLFAEGWSGTEPLLSAIRDVVESLPPRVPFYPGTKSRLTQALAAHPTADVIDWAGQSFLIAADLDPNQDQYAFRNEFFAPGIATTSLPGDTPASFLANATAFSNHSLYGTLAVNVLIDPATMKAHRPVLDQAVQDLLYGTIAVNSWVGHAYGFPRIPWGGFPGATLRNVESGIGFVHNGLMFDKPERTVVYGPFAEFPRSLLRGERHVEPIPPTYLTNRNATQVGERMTRQAVSRRWRDMPSIVMSALKG